MFIKIVIPRAQLKNQIVDNDGDCSVSTRRRRATWITPSKHSATRGYPSPQQHADVETDNYPSLQSPPPSARAGGRLIELVEYKIYVEFIKYYRKSYVMLFIINDINL